MYKQCSTEQAARRQRELEQGLLNRMREIPYEDISVSDLCDTMGIPRKAFYRYFSSKEGALNAMIDHTLTDYSTYTAFNPNVPNATLENIKPLFSFWQDRRDFLDALIRNDLAGLLVQRAMEIVKTEHLLMSDYLPDALRPYRDYVSDFVTSGLLILVVRWYVDGCQKSMEEMAGLALQLIAHPIFITHNQFRHPSAAEIRNPSPPDTPRSR